MKFSELLTELEQKGISISFSDGKIKYTGPEQYITPEIIENLKLFKGRLIKHLWPAECINMMPINTEGSKTPFILLHGEKMNYPLSEYFGPQQPFYGFFHYGSEGEKIFHRKVEAFAKDYISQLRKIVPNGPYYLAGFSFGGLIAFEMAVQLQKQGLEVPVLILIDCKNPISKEPVNGSNRISKISNQFYNYSKDVYYMFFHKARNLYYESYLLIKSRLHSNSRNYYIMGTYMEIAKKYKPHGKFNGEILLFKSRQNNSTHKNLGWDAFCNKVNLIIVEGNHKTIYETDESYKALSKNIGEWLEKLNNNSGVHGKMNGKLVDNKMLQ
jgi:thioesterase domain-containing protein